MFIGFILNMGLFDFEKVYEYLMWVKEFYGYVDYILEIEEYGVSFYVY